jgi:hypothetical protein
VRDVGGRREQGAPRPGGLVPHICELFLAALGSGKWPDVYETVVATTDERALLVALTGRLCERLAMCETWPCLIGIGDSLRHRDTSYGGLDCREFLGGILQFLEDLVTRDVGP